MAKRVSDTDFMAMVRDRYQSAIDADKTNRDRDHKDRLFYTGGEAQWLEGVPAERRTQGRPCESFNRLPQFVKQVSGEIRQNKPAIKVMPVDGQTDPEMAKIYTAIIRHIEVGSDAHRIYASETEKAVIGGCGWWRIKSSYTDDKGFDQDIIVEGIPNPNSVVCDPDARHVARADMKYCFVTELVSRKAFEKKYPDHGKADFGEYRGWLDGDFVRIAEYWERNEVRKEKIYAVVLPQGNEENYSETEIREMAGADKDVPLDALLDVMGVKVKATRSVPVYEVRSRLVCGNAPLSDWQAWPGKHIPLVRVVGEEVAAGDQIFRHGLIHHAKSAQMAYNYARNAIIERHALSTRAPWLVTSKMIAGFKSMWEGLNKGNPPVLVYDADAQAPSGPRQNPPPQLDAAAYQESLIASEDMKATTGIYDGSLGAKSNETSGIAIARREAQGDTATYVFIDNMEAAITHTGRILIDLIPHYYEDHRIIRLIGEDGEIEKFVALNEAMPDGKKWNDITRGKYDVIVSTGPAFATKRMEAADRMIQLAQVVPAIAQVAGDEIVKALDVPNGEKIAERIKMLLPPGVDPEADQKRAEAMQAMAPQPGPGDELQMRGMTAEVEGKEADAQLKKVQVAQATGEIEALVQGLVEQQLAAILGQYGPPTGAQPGI